jgi:hypothetical protein
MDSISFPETIQTGNSYSSKVKNKSIKKILIISFIPIILIFVGIFILFKSKNNIVKYESYSQKDKTQIAQPTDMILPTITQNQNEKKQSDDSKITFSSLLNPTGGNSIDNNSGDNSGSNSNVNKLQINNISGSVRSNESNSPNKNSSSSNNSNGANQGSPGSSNSNNPQGQSNNNETTDWKTYSNPSYGYTLKYPNNWFVKKQAFLGTTQSTSFSTNDNPNEIVVTFYIKATTDIDSVGQGGFKIYTHKTSNGQIYLYQCVHILEEEIMKNCELMVSTITFSN